MESVSELEYSDLTVRVKVPYVRYFLFKQGCTLVQLLAVTVVQHIQNQFCLVPRPHYSARPVRFGSRGPKEEVGQKRDIIAVAYKTKVSRFNVQNASLIDTDGKGEFIRMLSFLLLDKGRLFFTKLSFEVFEVFFTRWSAQTVL